MTTSNTPQPLSVPSLSTLRYDFCRTSSINHPRTGVGDRGTSSSTDSSTGTRAPGPLKGTSCH